MIEDSWQALLVLIAVEVFLCVLVFWIGFVKGGHRATMRHKDEVTDHLRRSRQTLGGKFADQLAPYFPEFNYDPTEARFLGSPIDFVVFPGMATGDPNAIVFVEVKSGKSQLDKGQRMLRKLVEQTGSKNIRFETVRLLKGGNQ